MSELFVDVSPWQAGTIPPAAWARLAAAGAPWIGAAIKVSEGRSTWSSWCRAHWPAIRAAGGERYGVDWFRIAYGFWRRDVPGPMQARVLLAELERAGGLNGGDLITVDVELCKANRGATAAEVEDGVSSWVDTVRSATGARVVLLYAGAWLAELGVRSRMGCSWLWYPSYTARLDRRFGSTSCPAREYSRAGAGLDGRSEHRAISMCYTDTGEAWEVRITRVFGIDLCNIPKRRRFCALGELSLPPRMFTLREDPHGRPISPSATSAHH